MKKVVPTLFALLRNVLLSEGNINKDTIKKFVLL